MILCPSGSGLGEKLPMIRGRRKGNGGQRGWGGIPRTNHACEITEFFQGFADIPEGLPEGPLGQNEGSQQGTQDDDESGAQTAQHSEEV
jgi:hypothetical protein